ncbi:NAD(P)H nitroreductase [Pseudoalteromonas sp. SSDWG2]|uniref:NAD(P)H nitroreductase n=1 Tax=Pseudoalteromonas sp. SSDWG2 TaxID=3139391 RepID=UPI003BA84A59
MNAKELLLNRQSDSQLSYPGPTLQQLELMQHAALRVPDHANLAPWEFIVLEDDKRDDLGQIFLQAAEAENMGERALQRAASLVDRAPMVIVCIMKYKPHDKVPRVEQLASAACATYAMQQAAFAQGLSGIWRTGAYAQSPFVKRALGLTEQDEIMGFLYVGTPTLDCPKKRRHQPGDFFRNSI